MEVERLVEDLRKVVGKSLKWPQTSEMMKDFGIDSKAVLHSPIQLDPKRTIATAAKLIAENPTIKDGPVVASMLLQWFGAGNAKAYEVEE